MSPFTLIAIGLFFAFLAFRAYARSRMSGRQELRLSARTTLSPDEAWAFLHDAGRRTALRFTPVRVHETEEDGTVPVDLETRQGTIRARFSMITDDEAHTVTLHRLPVHDEPHPLGEAHLERWGILPSPDGTLITLEAVIDGQAAANAREVARLQDALAQAANGEIGRPATARPAESRPQTRKGERFSLTRYRNEIVLSLLAVAILCLQMPLYHALVLAGLLVVHELGHLVAYRMLGYEGNRFMLIPFFGGLATTTAAPQTEFERGFTALMGPAFTMPLSVVASWGVDHTGSIAFGNFLLLVVMFNTIINLLNLLPIYPLDGGQFARSVIATFVPGATFESLAVVSGLGLAFLLWLGFADMALLIGILGMTAWMGLSSAPRVRSLSREDGLRLAILFLVTLAGHYWAFQKQFGSLF